MRTERQVDGGSIRQNSTTIRTPGGFDGGRAGVGCRGRSPRPTRESPSVTAGDECMPDRRMTIRVAGGRARPGALPLGPVSRRLAIRRSFRGRAGRSSARARASVVQGDGQAERARLDVPPARSASVSRNGVRTRDDDLDPADRRQRGDPGGPGWLTKERPRGGGGNRDIRRIRTTLCDRQIGVIGQVRRRRSAPYGLTHHVTSAMVTTTARGRRLIEFLVRPAVAAAAGPAPHGPGRSRYRGGSRGPARDSGDAAEEPLAAADVEPRDALRWRAGGVGPNRWRDATTPAVPRSGGAGTDRL
jgi:hypothetical protein